MATASSTGGNLQAIYHCGTCAQSSSWEEAVQFYKTAADAGHAPSQYNLGVCLSNGSGVGLDIGGAHRDLDERLLGASREQLGGWALDHRGGRAIRRPLQRRPLTGFVGEC